MSEECCAVLKIGSDNLLEVTELYSVTAEEYVTDAVVTLVSLVEKASGTAVPGAAGTVLAHVPGTTGEDVIYRGTLDHTAALTRFKWYVATVTCDAGPDGYATLQLEAQALYAGRDVA